MFISMKSQRAMRYVLLLASALLLSIVFFTTAESRALSAVAVGAQHAAPLQDSVLNDAYMELVPGAAGNCSAPSNGGTTMVGCRFALELWLNAGSQPEVPGHQSFLTF